MTGDFTDWITTAEASELTGYAAVHLRQLAQRGKIRAMKKGRDWLLSRKGVLAYAEKMRQLGTDKHDPWRTGARQKKRE
jgi:excisionase family DNA binding protein